MIPILGTVAASGGGPTPPPYTASAVHFDGATAVDHIGGFGASDSPFYFFNVWLKPTEDVGVQILVDDDVPFINTWLEDDKKVGVYVQDATGDNYLEFDSSAALPIGQWSNLRVVLDTNHPAGEKICQVYVGDTPLAGSVSDSSAAFNIHWSGITEFHAGSSENHSVGSFYIGDMANYWCGPQFQDQSIEANRRKWVDADGKPVDLGADGSTPTGTAPAVFFSGNAAAFATNKGTGGACTVTGSLTNATTSPSD